MVLLIIVGALLLGSALCKSVQDSIAHHNSQKRRGVWWVHEQSWKWKYATTVVDTGVGRTTFVQIDTPKFFGSTTWLVWTTDAWHCFGMLNMSAWQAALCLLLPLAWYYQVLAFVLIKVGYGGGFELLYRRLNKTK